MIDSSFLDALRRTISKSLDPQQIQTGDPTRREFVVNGEVVGFEVPFPDREHRVDTIDSMLLAADKWGGDGTLWHDHMGIALVCDDERRADVVLMTLTQSVQYLKLLTWCDGCSYTHKGLILVLRRLFKDCISDEDMLSISNLRIDRSSTVKSDVTKGRESGLNEFHRELATESGLEWPETIRLTVPVYSNADMQSIEADVTLTVDVDMDEGKIRVAVVPGELEAAINSVQQQIHRMLQVTKLPVFAGSPS